MSGAVITLRPEGFPGLAQHLARMAALDAGNFEAARREVGDYLVEEIKDHFETQTLVDGSAMPQSEAAKARSGKTLLAKGHLRDSYVYQLTDQGLEVGSAKVYAAIHHFGGMTGRGHKTRIIPRPVMGISADDERHIGDIFLDWIRRSQ